MFAIRRAPRPIQIGALLATLALVAGLASALLFRSHQAPVGAGSDPPFAINVTASPYNVNCNGTTDNTTGFQNALNATPAGGRVEVPASSGLCKITSTLTLPTGVVLEGEGTNASIIWCSCSSGAIIQIGSSGTSSGAVEHNGGVMHLGLEGNSAGNSGTSGVKFMKVFNAFVTDVYVQFVEMGFWIEGGGNGTYSGDLTITQPKTNAVHYGIYAEAGGSGGHVTDVRCCFGGYLFGASDHPGAGLLANGMTTSTFEGMTAEGFNYGIRLINSTSGNGGTSDFNQFIGDRVENITNQNGSQDFSCDGSTVGVNNFDDVIDADIAPSSLAIHNANSSGCVLK